VQWVFEKIPIPQNSETQFEKFTRFHRPYFSITMYMNSIHYVVILDIYWIYVGIVTTAVLYSLQHGWTLLLQCLGWHYQYMSQCSVRPGTINFDNYARSSSRWRRKLQEPQLRQLYPVGWTIVIHDSTVCRKLYGASCSLCRTPLHDWSLARDVVITSRHNSNYANYTGYPS